jgi:hypothetical protein
VCAETVLDVPAAWVAKSWVALSDPVPANTKRPVGASLLIYPTYHDGMNPQLTRKRIALIFAGAAVVTAGGVGGAAAPV